MREPPEFWTTVDGTATEPGGRQRPMRVRGWSHASLQEAAALAHDRLREATARIARGEARRGSYYPRMPLREERLHALHEGGSLIALVTRNRYGATVLSTDRVLIADVDLPPGPRRGLLSRLLGRRAPDDPGPAHDAAVAAAQTHARTHPDAGVHVYRTAAGLRVLVTGPEYAPPERRAAEVLTSLRADEVYTALCRAHGSYRARLSPKPWRIGIQAAPVAWPPADDHQGRVRAQWQQRYDERAGAYAACRLVSRTGPEASGVQAQILRLHDELSGALRDLPLA